MSITVAWLRYTCIAEESVALAVSRDISKLILCWYKLAREREGYGFIVSYVFPYKVLFPGRFVGSWHFA